MQLFKRMQGFFWLLRILILHTDQNHLKAESEHKSSKCKPNFTGAEVEVLLLNVDVSILFQYGYINAIEFCAYLFIHLHLQCS